jgi:hypothetical protein
MRTSSTRTWRRLVTAGAVAAFLGCDAPAATFEPVFLLGRAAEPAGDSLFAVTARDAGAVLLYDPDGRVRDTLGTGILHNPDRVQANGGAWYVSDVAGGQPEVVILEADGALRRRVPLAGIATHAHQFAALPDGAIVVETRDGRLVALRGDSVSTFAPVEIGARPSLVMGAAGGVLHAIPDKTITLYNGFGSIRWRVEWPWAETAFVSAIGEDTRGRIHFIAGVAQDDTFIVYSMAPGSGEIVRWSVPSPAGSFMADRLGEVVPARGRWAAP